MPFYNDLRPISDDKRQSYSLVFPQDFSKNEKIRTIENLLLLRQDLNIIPAKRSDKNLLIGSWNIKEFGNTTQRLPEAYFYIAEIINRFDLVAIQEIKTTLRDLDIIMRLLGSDWRYLINDVTEGVKGNRERSAYIYNKKRVTPSGLAGEITLWPEVTKGKKIKQLYRTPYLTGFKSGWKKFSIINLHLLPGEKKEDIKDRKEEVDLLVEVIKLKLDKKRFWNDNIILLGDMNFYRPTRNSEKDKPAIEKLVSTGFRELQSLQNIDTNASLSEAYDRMFFNVSEMFKIAKDGAGLEKGGVFNFFNTVYKDGQHSTYKKFMLDVYGGNADLTKIEELKKYYLNTWRKNQVSDHFPIWAEIIIDSSDEFLSLKREAIINS